MARQSLPVPLSLTQLKNVIRTFARIRLVDLLLLIFFSPSPSLLLMTIRNVNYTLQKSFALIEFSTKYNSSSCSSVRGKRSVGSRRVCKEGGGPIMKDALPLGWKHLIPIRIHLQIADSAFSSHNWLSFSLPSRRSLILLLLLLLSFNSKQFPGFKFIPYLRCRRVSFLSTSWLNLLSPLLRLTTGATRFPPPLHS